jgi:hypothetical protein
MIEAGGPSTSELQACFPKSCARPTGGSHGLTARGPAQRGEGAKAKAAPRKVPKKRGQGHYKGRSPVGSRPEVLEEPQ